MTQQQLQSTGSLAPNFYSASVTAGIFSQSVSYVPSTRNIYYAPGPGYGTGASLTAGWATDPNGFVGGPSASGCFFDVVGGCAGASTSGDVAVQFGFGLGGWGGSSGYGVDPIQTVVMGMYSGSPANPLATVPDGSGMYWEDPSMGLVQ